jgi:hypothetical protein
MSRETSDVTTRTNLTDQILSEMHFTVAAADLSVSSDL